MHVPMGIVIAPGVGSPTVVSVHTYFSAKDVCICMLTFLMLLSCDSSWPKVHTLFHFMQIWTCIHCLTGVLFVSFRATLKLELKSYCMAIGHWMTKFGNFTVSVLTTSFLIQYLYDLYQTVISHWEVPFS